MKKITRSQPHHRWVVEAQGGSYATSGTHNKTASFQDILQVVCKKR